jgi:uncharacterized protein YodC (DUF2158 family)
MKGKAFSIGETVRLKSGGPDMTVKGLSESTAPGELGNVVC